MNTQSKARPLTYQYRFLLPVKPELTMPKGLYAAGSWLRFSPRISASCLPSELLKCVFSLFRKLFVPSLAI